VEHFDFEAVTQDVWSHLHSWYSADHIIVRLIKRDRFNPKRMYLDLYPGKKSIRLMVSEDSMSEEDL